MTSLNPVQAPHSHLDADDYKPSFHPRTIRDAAAWFKTRDPGTAITEYRIRQLVVSGTVPSVMVGRKYLVTIEALEEYFSTPTPSEIKPVSAARQVYKIS